MPVNVITTDAQGLASVPLPTHGSSYTVVSHKLIIDEVLAQLQSNNFTLNNTEYRRNVNGEIAQGVYHMQYGNDPDMGLMFAWANSYDKTMRFRCAIGAYVFVCGNGLIAGDMSNYGRIHKADAVKEVKDHIAAQIGNANVYFKELIQDKEDMKGITVTEEQAAELMGLLYFKENVISSSQLIVIKDQFKKPAHSYNAAVDSLWTVYNHITFALKKSHPKSWMEQQKNLHKIIKAKFMTGLPVADPNQLSLLDAAEEAEDTVIVTETSNEIAKPAVETVEPQAEEGILGLDDYADSFEEPVKEEPQVEAVELLSATQDEIQERTEEEPSNIMDEIQEVQTPTEEQEAPVLESTSEFPTPPSGIPMAVEGTEDVFEGYSESVVPELEIMNEPINIDTTVIEKLDDNNYLVETSQGPAIATPESNISATPLEEQVAGEVVEPVSEAELEVSADPIVNQEDEMLDIVVPEKEGLQPNLDFEETKPTQDFDFDKDQENLNTGTLESPFEF